MMNPRRNSVFALSLLAMSALPISSFANSVTLNRDAVVPIVFDNALNISDSQAGDRFTCHVEGDRDLPTGTRLQGRIVSIRIPRGDRPASMDLEFTSIELPNGVSTRIHALPIPLNKDLVRADDNGRLFVRNDVRRQGAYVIGGALGGYLLGSLFHRRVTGLFLGTVAGMIAADSDRTKSQNTVVDRGTKMGALFNQDVTLEISDRGRGSWDRGWDSSRPTSGGSSNSGWDGTHHGGGSDRGWDSSKPRTDSQTAPPTAPPATPPAPAVPDISIRLGDKALTFDAEAAPYYDGEVVMVPVERMASLLELSFEKGDKNSAYIESADNSIKLEQDSATYRFNGKRSPLSHPAVVKKDVLYAPASVFAALTTKDLVVNGNKLDSKGLN